MGQCHEIVDLYFLCALDSTWAPYEQAKTVYERLHLHCVHVVNNFAGTVSANSMTTQTLCPSRQKLFWLVSTQSTTTPTHCQHIKQLCGHTIFENNKLNLLLPLSLVFFQK